MFDSGVGGLTVFSEIVKELPNENIIYLGDTKNFPYGSKSKEAIIELSKKCVDFLISQNVKLIVIACGTATSQSLEVLQKIYNVPIIGIIEPTIKAIKDEEENIKNIGVIATQGTIRSNAWEKCILENIKNVKVLSKACSLLAPMAEEGWIDNEVAFYTIKEYMKDFKNIDKLILGCTHYPLFKNLIQKELGESVDIVNTGEKLAKYLNKFLVDNNLQNIDNREPNYNLLLTDTECNFINVANKLLNYNVKSIEKIVL
jgi:glutamate racemase